MNSKNILKNVLIGADIELFLMRKDNNQVVSAEGYIKGEKNAPFNFDPSNKFFATSLDNVLAEFCIPPATNREEFLASITKSVEYINKTIPADLCTVARPSAFLDPIFLDTENAQKFGCEPDYNAWIRDMNPRPEGVDPTLRSAGGHIHVGYDDSEELGFNLKEDIVKTMDLYLGIPSVIMEPDNERKMLYGKAGAFRFKHYGVEYRTISNFYLASNALTNWAYDSTIDAVTAINNGFRINSKLGDRIVSTINNNNKKEAEKLIKEFQLELV